MQYYKGDQPLKRKWRLICWRASCLLRFLSADVLEQPRQADQHRRHDPADHPRRGRARRLHRLQYQKGLAQEDAARQAELKDYTYELLFELYDNEVEYTQDPLRRGRPHRGRQKFLRYNANKALMGLGYEALFPRDETT